jgi:hypothetical protein
MADERYLLRRCDAVNKDIHREMELEVMGRIRL